MKNLSLYLLLCILSLMMIITIDLLSGMSLPMAFQSIYSAFSTTTLQEYIIMIILLITPIIIVIAKSLYKRTKSSNE